MADEDNTENPVPNDGQIGPKDLDSVSPPQWPLFASGGDAPGFFDVRGPKEGKIDGYHNKTSIPGMRQPISWFSADGLGISHFHPQIEPLTFIGPNRDSDRRPGEDPLRDISRLISTHDSQTSMIGFHDDLSTAIVEAVRKLDTNPTYGLREVDLAVGGWSWYAIQNTQSPIINRITQTIGLTPGLEYRIEKHVYNFQGTLHTGTPHVAIYVRGAGIKPKVPEQVIREARRLKHKSHNRQAFLMSVYKQITRIKHTATGAIKALTVRGRYAQMYHEGSENTAAILHYFADKLDGLGRTEEAKTLYDKVQQRFPHGLRYQQDWLGSDELTNPSPGWRRTDGQYAMAPSLPWPAPK